MSGSQRPLDSRKIAADLVLFLTSTLSHHIQVSSFQPAYRIDPYVSN